MESNGYEHHLFLAVKALSTLVRKAYWHDRCHCGADVTDDCLECDHHPVCIATDELDKAISQLDEWSC